MLRTAFRLRLADLGGYGVIPAAAAWFIPLVYFMAIPIFSLFFAPIILAIMAAALFFAGSPTRLQRWIMAGSILIGLSAFAYFWWAFGRYDRCQRCDDSRPEISNIRRSITACHTGKYPRLPRGRHFFFQAQQAPRKLNHQDFRLVTATAFRRSEAPKTPAPS